jgi:phospho-N-acetylmuramoyl-pentapeptide-transferase
MLYHLFDWLSHNGVRIPGGGLFQFITFRALMAILLSLIITMIYGKRIINLLKRKQIGESVRELGLAGENLKKGTPTMGGIIILMGILIPTLLFADINKVYIRLILLSTVWLGIVGFVDDLLKLQAKRRIQQMGKDYKKTTKTDLQAGQRSWGR